MATDQTYNQIKYAFQAAAGITAMEANDEWFFLNSLNRAAHRAWGESELWPRYLVVSEERAIVPEYKQGETRQVYTWGTNLVNTRWENGVSDDEEIVFYLSTVSASLPTGLTAGTVYYAEVATSKSFYVRDKPQTDPTSARVTFTSAGSSIIQFFYVRHTDNYRIPDTEQNKGTIGEWLRMYTAAPYPRSSQASEVEFYASGNAAYIVNPSPRVGRAVWVTYKKVWDGPYDEDSIDIPEEWADYIIHSILSDFYRGDGQNEKAQLEEAVAMRMLTQQISRLSYTNRNPYALQNIKTHGTIQVR